MPPVSCGGYSIADSFPVEDRIVLLLSPQPHPDGAARSDRVLTLMTGYLIPEERRAAASERPTRRVFLSGGHG